MSNPASSARKRAASARYWSASLCRRNESIAGDVATASSRLDPFSLYELMMSSAHVLDRTRSSQKTVVRIAVNQW
jgi:hypothetical protein